ncbi:GreA/GreB family elongation factor [Chryseosolibacter indicus]|uniref:GreA/GreB family elongation factor n=1 Tax=Chryseosolibacter indicus TaxID=2782351 RepID=A0ABS5VZR7_9BACT|nr:GreA/GreB family elongation factor [Chryseosolibacter indicus]MBT1706219.1 GreA/GreB family elongation factor [Chryseosolibacter indicus]
MQEKIIITTRDYDRLMGLLEVKGVRIDDACGNAMGGLYHTLTKAEKMPPENIDGIVITMNSKVLLCEVNSGRELELTITYPQDADHGDRRISVLSPIGLALLGRRENDVVSWKIPTGAGYFKVIKVTYQPEAEGHYFL